MSNKTLSACLITKDEAHHLPVCLESLRRQVDEVVVVDTGSCDDTVAVAKRLGARVWETQWTGDFADARNQSLGHATSDFILVIDADEIAPPNLRERFTALTAVSERFIGQVRIRSPYTDQAQQKRVAVSHVSRLFSRSNDIRFYGRIHEQVADSSRQTPHVTTDITLEHSGYDLPETLMAEKTQRNLDLLRQALHSGDGPPHHQAYLQYQLGKSLFALARWEEAHVALRSGFEMTPREAPYRPELLMTVLHTLKRLDLAEDIWSILTQGLREYPDLPDLHFFMAGALIYFGIPDLPTIERCYRTCLAIGEKTAKYPSVEGVGSYLAYYNLGLLCAASGRHEEASQLFAKAGRMGYALAP